MSVTTKIFKQKLIDKYLSKFSYQDIESFEDKWKLIQKWKTLYDDGLLDNIKEISINAEFINDIFGTVLGYATLLNPAGEVYNLKREKTTFMDSSRPDGVLGYFSKEINDVRVVIELKDATTDLDKKQKRHDHRTPVEQAFSYFYKYDGRCNWIIVSNFVEIRLYRTSTASLYESFNLKDMDNKSEFLKFYYLLCKEHLISQSEKSIVDTMFHENKEMEDEISNEFYDKYKEIRQSLYTSLIENNPEIDELTLFTKSQKIMDRFIFIFFCQQTNLLPAHTYENLVNSVHNSFNISIWNQLKGLFEAINEGNPDKNINGYNGGLFKKDIELDNLIVEDAILERFIEFKSYDFNSDLNVNILGQIFEQSISDVEEIKKEINGIEPDDGGKRKKDGIFYTPYYITRYIVEETVGTYLKNKREEIKQSLFKDGIFKTIVTKQSTNRKNKIEIKSWEDIPLETEGMSDEEQMHIDAVKQLHLAYWKAYEDVLKNIKICDPACGSGAFLNQCFDYLYEEMQFILDSKWSLAPMDLSEDITSEILQNNLFGVDKNPESVEITKLSLWLKTARKNQPLTTLDNNIKCGNSLVNDKDICGEFAFNWEEEFSEIFAAGGFDIIIGNPPYGAKVDSLEKNFINNHFKTMEGIFDTYKAFFELGINLLKPNGYLGYITPNTYFGLKKSGKKLRKFLFDNVLLKIVEAYDVFQDASVDPVISIYQKRQVENAPLEIVLFPRKIEYDINFISRGTLIIKNQKALRKNPDLSFNYKIDQEKEQIIDEIKDRSDVLEDFYSTYNGAKPYCTGKGIPPQTKEMGKKGRSSLGVYESYEQVDDTWVPYMRGKNIFRFFHKWDRLFIKYGENLAEPRNPEIFFREKIFIRQTSDSLIATLDLGNVSNNTLHIIFSTDKEKYSNKYLLGLLNSKLMNWIYRYEYPLEDGKENAEIKLAFIRKLPVIIGTPEKITKVEGIVDNLLVTCQKRQEEKENFLNATKTIYGLKKISQKMWDFEKLSYEEFLGELEKDKKLTVKDKYDLFSILEEKTKRIKNLNKVVLNLQIELDDTVFKIYNISEDVQKMIKTETEIIL
ncbi:MAG: BREX-1 system adenine-specific DNA-methyltransferase PglX [Bacteroidales bacterium]|nr:TaqI-like C-terminal specificity domain-containing protein [Anaerotignum sp.]MCI5678958.1 BREX-1 system adenine-specific DNA-methyltransferase PglX [Bacteroidales bacterium]MDY3927142.1 TaqI-like C-terminal specificity domain-containing protein [Anaerotignum sp.]